MPGAYGSADALRTLVTIIGLMPVGFAKINRRRVRRNSSGSWACAHRFLDRRGDLHAPTSASR